MLAPYEEHRHRATRDDIAMEYKEGANYCMAVNLLWWLLKLARRWIAQADKILCVLKEVGEDNLRPGVRAKKQD